MRYKQSVLSILIFLFILCIPVSAKDGDTITVDIPNFRIEINNKVSNSSEVSKTIYDDYPYFLYNNITYLQLTYYNSVVAGLEVQTNGDVINITKRDLSFPLEYYNMRLGNDVFPEKLGVSFCPYDVYIGDELYISEEYPVLWYKDVVCIPLTWYVAHDLLGWKYEFSENGLVLSGDTFYYHSLGDSYYKKTEISTIVMVQPASTYYSKDDVSIYMSVDKTNRMQDAFKIDNLTVRYGDTERTLNGCFGYFQKKGPLFTVSDEYIYTTYFEVYYDFKNVTSCKINISSGELIFE